VARLLASRRGDTYGEGRHVKRSQTMRIRSLRGFLIPNRRRSRLSKHVDWLGALTATAAVGGLVFGLLESSPFGFRQLWQIRQEKGPVPFPAARPSRKRTAIIGPAIFKNDRSFAACFIISRVHITLL
jgi:hypothetical protein